MKSWVQKLKSLNIFLYICAIGLLLSCIGGPDLKVKINDSSISGGKSESAKSQLTNVDIRNNTVTINGHYLNDVTEIRLLGKDGFNEELAIETKSATSIIAKGLAPLTIPLTSALSLLIKDSYGATTYPLTFELQDGVVTGAKINDMGATSGQVLMFDGTTWGPGDLAGLTYAGNWDASSGSAPSLTPGTGEYFIVNNAGTTNLNGINSWAVGDWAVWNSVDGQWEKIDNATNVTSFNGRNGAVTPWAGDYNISQLAGVDLTGAVAGKVLKYDGTNWVVADDLTGGGSGTVTNTELQDNAVTSNKIADDSIVDADINSAAAISQSKISGLVSDLAGKLSLSGGTMSGPIDMNGENIVNPGTVDGVDVAALSTSVSTNSSNISSNNSAIIANSASIATNSTDIANLENRKVEDFTTACADDQILTADSGVFICANLPVSSYWTLNGSDINYAGGNVGVGVASPQANVDIAGGIKVSQVSAGRITGDKGLIIDYLPGTGARLMQVSGATADVESLIFGIANDEKMRLVSSGYIGIGTQAPTAAIDIVSQDVAGINATRINNTNAPFLALTRVKGTEVSKLKVGASDTLGQLRFRGFSRNSGDTADEEAILATVFGRVESVDAQERASAGLHFSTSENSALSTIKMSILPNGNVGIGTETPSEKLEVSGNVKATAFYGDGSNLTNLSSSNSSNTGNVTINSDSDLNGSGDIIFQTAGSSQVVISNAGNLGIGGNTAPNNLLTVGSNLATGYAISANSPTANGAIIQTSEAAPSANSALLITTTADGGSTSSPLFKVQNNGNVGIGTDTPTKKLHVVGDTYIDSANLIVGSGDGATPGSSYLKAAAAGGSNSIGADFYIDASNGTGSGGSGNINFRTAPPIEGTTVTYGTSTTKTFSSASTTLAHTVTAQSNQILIVNVGIAANRSVTALTFNGVALTELATEGTSPRVSVWYLLNPPAVTANISLTLSGSTDGSLAASNFYNVNQITPFSGLQQASGSSTGSTLSISSSVGSTVVSAFYSWSDPTPGLGQTSLYKSNQFGERTAMSIAAGAASVDMEWSLSSDTWRHVAFSLDTSGSGATTSNVLQSQMTIKNNGNVGIGLSDPKSKLEVGGAIVSRAVEVPASGVVDLSTSNSHYLDSIGGTTITLENLVGGGSYTIVVRDTTSKTYTFSGCDVTKFNPANAATTIGTDTIYNIMAIDDGTNMTCYINWLSGFQ